MTKERKRSDYRTAPHGERHANGLSFAEYLLGPYTRGHDWMPDRPPSSALQLHHQAQANGHFTRLEEGSGKPRMRRKFLSWVSGAVLDVPGVAHADVQRAIIRARLDAPEVIAVLEWRQERPSARKRTSVAFCAEHSISASTLTRRFYKAVQLVGDIVAEEWGRVSPCPAP